MQGGCDDEKSAYRWKGVREEDQRFNVVAYWDCRRHRMMFVELWGHPFGLASAVLTYNRDPELHVAIMRALLFSPCTHFYDDHLTLDLSVAGGSGQHSYAELCRLTGKKLDTEKHSGMAPVVIFTGCSLDLNRVFSSGVMTIGPKPGRLEKITVLIRQSIVRSKPLYSCSSCHSHWQTRFRQHSITGARSPLCGTAFD